MPSREGNLLLKTGVPSDLRTGSNLKVEGSNLTCSDRRQFRKAGVESWWARCRQARELTQQEALLRQAGAQGR